MPVSEADRQKWNQRYTAGAYADRTHASAFLVEQLDRQSLLPAAGCWALDLACGAGRNSVFLAEQGFRVDAVDISDVGLARGLTLAQQCGVEGNITWHCRDLQSPQDLDFAHHGSYGLILMVRFVAGHLLPHLIDALTPGGVLLVEEHLQWPDGELDLSGPSSGRFRLRPGELRRGFTGADAHEVLFDEEGLYTEPDGSTAALCRMVVRAAG